MKHLLRFQSLWIFSISGIYLSFGILPNRLSPKYFLTSSSELILCSGKLDNTAIKNHTPSPKQTDCNIISHKIGYSGFSGRSALSAMAAQSPFVISLIRLTVDSQIFCARSWALSVRINVHTAAVPDFCL